MEQVPSREQVRMIFKEAYILYVKYIERDQIDWEEYHKELMELSHKYPFELATQMLVEVTDVIEKNFQG